MTKLKACVPLFCNENWKRFEELLNEHIEREMSTILNATDLNKIIASQARIKTYKQIISFPTEAKLINK